MDIRLEITGRSPMLMHNIQLVDPDNPFVREIATYTSKRKKTEDDRREIERLEWFGGLYVEDGHVVLPTGNIRKSFINAGKVTKQGTQVTRALNFIDLNVSLTYDGPEDIDILFKDSAFHNRAAVGVGNKRVMRVRPQFPTWAVVADAFLLEDVMDLSDLELVAKRAGLAEGIGDNRVNGYGRFDVKVVAL